MIKIAIVPKIIETYKKQFELSVEKNLLDLLKKRLKFKNVEILSHDSNLNKFNVFISSGGNNIKRFSKDPKDKIRNLFELKVIKQCIKKKSTYFGICYGAQFVADFYGGVLNKNDFNGEKEHSIKFINNFNFIKDKKKMKVNSFHDYKIKKLNNNLVPYAIFEDDNSVEFFKHKYKNIYGIMWHPERFEKISATHQKFLKKILCS